MNTPINTPGGMQDNATLDEYQEAATATAIYPGRHGPMGLMYAALKMNGEAGEFAEGVGKAMRDDGFAKVTGWDRKHSRFENDPVNDARREMLKKELGDVLWYVAAAATELGFTLNEVAHGNLEKLHDRAARGKLQGSGDDR